MRKLVMLPGPTNVPDRVMNAMLTPIINHRSEEFSELHKRIIEQCKKVFETKNEIVVLSASGTGGVDAAVGSILQQGETVVIPSFGEFSSRLGDSARYTGAQVIAPAADLGQVPPLSAVESAMKSAGSAKALCVVYNETSTGVTWRKLKELKEIAARYGALFVVDAISVLGGDHLPVDELGADICITGSQKCLACPPGLALVSFSDAARKAISQIHKPRTQYFDIEKYFAYAERGETPFTPALPLFFALDEALNIILEEGLQNRIRRHALCARAFYDAFEAIGMNSLARGEDRSHTVIGILCPPGLDESRFRKVLSEKFGILIAGGFGKLKGKMFRIGSMGEINPQLVITTISGISNSLKLCGFDCDATKAVDAVLNVFQELAPPQRIL